MTATSEPTLSLTCVRFLLFFILFFTFNLLLWDFVFIVFGLWLTMRQQCKTKRNEFCKRNNSG